MTKIAQNGRRMTAMHVMGLGEHKPAFATKVEQVLRAYQTGKLKDPAGSRVKNRSQAIIMAMAQASKRIKKD